MSVVLGSINTCANSGATTNSRLLCTTINAAAGAVHSCTHGHSSNVEGNTSSEWEIKSLQLPSVGIIFVCHNTETTENYVYSTRPVARPDAREATNCKHFLSIFTVPMKMARDRFFSPLVDRKTHTQQTPPTIANREGDGVQDTMREARHNCSSCP